MGGFARVGEALGTVCKDLGVKFRFECPVSEVCRTPASPYISHPFRKRTCFRLRSLCLLCAQVGGRTGCTGGCLIGGRVFRQSQCFGGALFYFAFGRRCAIKQDDDARKMVHQSVGE